MSNFYLLFAIISILSLYSETATGYEESEIVRQAPFCVDDADEPNLARFSRIFDHYRVPYRGAGPTFIPVSPDTFRSPTGFIQNVVTKFVITLNRIHINSDLLPTQHTWRKLHNFFHITIKAAEQSDGMEGLYIQAIGAPLGVPVGEFVTDFDCGDCSIPSSSLKDITYQIPCSHQPAASFVHPTILSIGGDLRKPIRKFREAHFNFRYIDYPCYDVIYAQFLIIAVRSFSQPLFEVFFSSMYKVNIEGIGSPYPMYYGWTPDEIMCHDSIKSHMDNWIPQKNQKTKVKFNEEYENCRRFGRGLITEDANICPPGPVHCGINEKEYVSGRRIKPPQSLSQWIKLRKDYVVQNNKERGTEVFCKDCGTWEDLIGSPNWPLPPIIVEDEDIDTEEIPLADDNKTIIYILECETRDAMGKDPEGNRNRSMDSADCEKGFGSRLTNLGYRTGQKLLKIHGLLMIFVWTMGSNCLMYCGRFMKESSLIEKASGCFGVGNWLWHHMFWTYLSAGIMSAGAGLFGILTTEQLNITCYSYDLKEDTEKCFESGPIHKVLGCGALALFFMGYFSGWERPTENRTLRNLVILYHIICGYLGKYIGLINLATIPSSVMTTTVICIIVGSEVSFWIFFAAGTLVQRAIDKQAVLRLRERTFFPTMEAIDTFIDSSLHTPRALLFPALILTQLGLFLGLCFYTYG